MTDSQLFQVTLQPSGHTFTVKKDEFILEAALRQDIAFPYGCKTGSCGTCLGKVVSGEIAYPDGLPLTVMEHEHKLGKAVFCVSVAKSDLTLEVKEVDVVGFKAQILPARVASLKKLSSDVMQVLLKLPESKPFDFHPGQFIEFILRDRSRRAFSLANSSNKDEFLELHIRHVVDGSFTTHVFEEMKEKAIVRFEGPFGSFHISDKSNRPLILIAGGTGFAPLKGLIEQLIMLRDTRPIHFYWGVRAEEDLYLNDLAKEWGKGSEINIKYIPVLSDSDENNWEGRTGFVHEAILEDFDDLSAYDVYTAGPPPMIDAIKTSFTKKGLPEDQLYSDSFEFSPKD